MIYYYRMILKESLGGIVFTVEAFDCSKDESSFLTEPVLVALECFEFLGVFDLIGLKSGLQFLVVDFGLFGILGLLFGLFGDVDLNRRLLCIASLRSLVPGRPQWYNDGDNGHFVGLKDI